MYSAKTRAIIVIIHQSYKIHLDIRFALCVLYDGGKFA